MEQLYSYGILTVSTLMFGFMFFFKDIYRKNYGSGWKATLTMSIGGGFFGLIVLILINGFVLEFSVFALIMAIFTTINGIAFSFCSLKALGKINLSLYSLFSMLGGMALPFISGIFFHGEPFTLNKAVCFIIITIALTLTAEKDNKKTGTIYYIGIFVLNGLSGVIAKIYHSLPFEKISSAGYSILSVLVTIILASFLLLFVKEEKKKLNLSCIFAMAGCGILGRVANWLLLIALLNLPASAQYPFVTGGTMIVSTLISLFSDKKPTKREIAAVILSFVGILLLIFIPQMQIFKISWR
ncbi:MAG: EamA family transporter [Clostridia bacterium]|nr:EamA family transporter [Clostridia bacterium]